MQKEKTEQRFVALSFETVSAMIAAETMREVLEVLRLTEEQLDFSVDVLNSFKVLIGTAAENAQREADRCMQEDLKAERPEGLPLT